MFCRWRFELAKATLLSCFVTIFGLFNADAAPIGFVRQGTGEQNAQPTGSPLDIWMHAEGVGPVVTGDTVQRQFKIANSQPTPIRLTGITTSCGCTETKIVVPADAKLPLELEPNSPCELALQIHTLGRTGENYFNVRLTGSREGVNFEQLVSVKLDILRVTFAEPAFHQVEMGKDPVTLTSRILVNTLRYPSPEVEFGSSHPDKLRVTSRVISSKDEDPSKSEKQVDREVAEVSLEFVPDALEPSQRYCIWARVKGSITVLEIPIYARAPRQANSVSPKFIVFTKFKRSARVAINVTNSKLLDTLVLASNPPNVKVDIERATPKLAIATISIGDSRLTEAGDVVFESQGEKVASVSLSEQ